MKEAKRRSGWSISQNLDSIQVERSDCQNPLCGIAWYLSNGDKSLPYRAKH
jgi:hypothetical protein